MSFEQSFAHRLSQFVDVGIGCVAADLEKEFAGEGITVGLKTGRWNAEDDIARCDRFAVDDLWFIDDADDETG